jgi:D-ribulokinase
MPRNTGWRLMPHADLFVGLDLGTSGARAVVMDAGGQQIAEGSAAMAGDHRAPPVWWQAAAAALDAALAQVDRACVKAMAVDGTSGTMLAVDAQGRALTDGLMYNDPCTDAGVLARIAAVAPVDSAARGATSGLARALVLQPTRPHRVLHQADWIAFHLSGRMVTDANNALKTGYDPVAECWPGWMAETGLDLGLLPEVIAPGTAIGPVTAQAADRFGLPISAQVVAGTTDGCASFLATGAAHPGDGVTVLGTTLTLKILSDRPVSAPEYGIYSHRLLGMWLAGGASNSGGAALLAHFSAADLARLSPLIDPETDSGLDYYPLPRPGERFPVANPDLAPRVAPRPADDARFLQGLFEGIAGIEAAGYERLAALGAPRLRTLRSLGGGAGNPVWTRLRQRRLGVPMRAPQSDAAAYGAALLAQRGMA